MKEELIDTVTSGFTKSLVVTMYSHNDFVSLQVVQTRIALIIDVFK